MPGYFETHYYYLSYVGCQLSITWSTSGGKKGSLFFSSIPLASRTTVLLLRWHTYPPENTIDVPSMCNSGHSMLTHSWAKVLYFLGLVKSRFLSKIHGTLRIELWYFSLLRCVKWRKARQMVLRSEWITCIVHRFCSLFLFVHKLIPCFVKKMPDWNLFSCSSVNLTTEVYANTEQSARSLLLRVLDLSRHHKNQSTKASVETISYHKKSL